MHCHSGFNTEEVVDFCQEVLNAIETWCIRWVELQENAVSLYCGGANGMLNDHEDQHQQPRAAVISRASRFSQNELVDLPTFLRRTWIKHMDDEQGLPQRRSMEKQRSISSLQETGVGSFDHLNGLTLEQLQDMERLVYEHDSNSCYGTTDTNDQNSKCH